MLCAISGIGSDSAGPNWIFPLIFGHKKNVFPTTLIFNVRYLKRKLYQNLEYHSHKTPVTCSWLRRSCRWRDSGGQSRRHSGYRCDNAWLWEVADIDKSDKVETVPRPCASTCRSKESGTLHRCFLFYKCLIHSIFYFLVSPINTIVYRDSIVFMQHFSKHLLGEILVLRSPDTRNVNFVQQILR